jgi:hypothetical protein
MKKLYRPRRIFEDNGDTTGPLEDILMAARRLCPFTQSLDGAAATAAVTPQEGVSTPPPVVSCTVLDPHAG